MGKGRERETERGRERDRVRERKREPFSKHKFKGLNSVAFIGIIETEEKTAV